ncbi:MAG TPA: type II toxin-antitoxin system RelE/ParE family toxin [Propionicimonas sp.]|jgi:mRNA interferase RelE/StbE
MAKVVLTGDAREDLRDLDGAARKVVLKAIAKLRDNPEMRGEPLGSRQTGNLTTFRKLVVGNRDYRVVFRVDPEGTVCVIWVIGRRVDEECYQLAMARLQLHADVPYAAQMKESLEQIWSGGPQR